MALLLSVDAGTTSVKAGIFKPDGQCLAVERFEYQLETPAPGFVELDPEKYWQACREVVRRAVQQVEAGAGQIAVVTVSSQGETTIPVDRNGRPLHPAIVWLDNRAGEEARQLDQQLGAQAYAVAGIPEISPTWTACKILWLKNNRPEIFAGADKFLLVQDWLIYRMTGGFVTDGSVACTSLLMDITANRWWPEALQAVSLPEDKLCEISTPGAIAGRLTDQAARDIGLTPGTPVVLGGMDQSVGAIGAGNIEAGIISESTGAALVMQISIPRPNLDRSRRVPVNLHSVSGLYLFQPIIPTAGMAFKWFRDVFAGQELEAAKSIGVDAYDLLTAEAANAPPGADGLLMLPHLSGALNPVYNSEARGVFCGFTLAHQKGHFVRAILEAVAFMLRRNLETVVNAGIEAREIRASGGGARSELWNQIKADVCNLPVVTLGSEEAALLGDAILGGVAAGIFGSLREGAQKMAALADRIEPGPNVEIYEAAYRRYCELDSLLDEFFRK